MTDIFDLCPEKLNIHDMDDSLPGRVDAFDTRPEHTIIVTYADGNKYHWSSNCKYFRSAVIKQKYTACIECAKKTT